MGHRHPLLKKAARSLRCAFSVVAEPVPLSLAVWERRRIPETPLTLLLPCELETLDTRTSLDPSDWVSHACVYRARYSGFLLQASTFFAGSQADPRAGWADSVADEIASTLREGMKRSYVIESSDDPMGRFACRRKVMSVDDGSAGLLIALTCVFGPRETYAVVGAASGVDGDGVRAAVIALDSLREEPVEALGLAA